MLRSNSGDPSGLYLWFLSWLYKQFCGDLGEQILVGLPAHSALIDTLIINVEKITREYTVQKASN
jgi:hypothetical protein